MNKPKRILNIDGGLNFRDIGGYNTQSGKTVQYGCYFRSGSLSMLTQTGMAQLETLNIANVVDLRSVDEANQHPDQLPISIARHHFPVKDPSRVPRLRALWAILVRRNRLDAALLEGYTRVMIDANGRVIGDSLRLIATSTGATVVHCTAGKDRTGLFSAILLRILGVDEATILEDYALSDQFADEIGARVAKDLDRLRRIGISEAQIRPLLGANPAMLQAALRHIDASYGSLSAYLLTQCGVDDGLAEQLRSRLLQ